MNSSRRRSGRRSAAALVAGLALTAGLAACGDDGSDDSATDPASSSPTKTAGETPAETPSETPSETPTDSPETGAGGQETIPAAGSAGVTEATLLSATEGGGSASTTAFALDSDQAVADFSAQLGPGFAETVGTTANEMAAELAEQGPAATLYGATAAIGCEAPRSVAIEAGEAGFQVTPKLPKSTVQCLAPVTFVVLFAVPDA